MNTSYQLTNNDLNVLRLVQRHFGFSVKPFKDIAEKLNLSEQDVIHILSKLRDEGFITRIGPFFNLDRSSGYVSLVAMIVPEEKFKEISMLVNEYQEVAHNYKRNHQFNMWFVLAAKSIEDAMKLLEEIENKTNLKTYNLPKLKEYNLDLYLDV